MTKILLASKSPRRQQLITTLGYPVEVVSIDVDEAIDGPIPADLVAETLAQRKANGYSERLNEDELLVTADTVVVHNGAVLGKPHSKAQAQDMLRSLSGDIHHVYTGVCIKTCHNTITFTEDTKVKFKELTDNEINHYIDTFQPFDKAGSYGIQEWIGMIGIEWIDGCYYNVMGLPTAHLYSAIKSLLTD